MFAFEAVQAIPFLAGDTIFSIASLAIAIRVDRDPFFAIAACPSVDCVSVHALIASARLSFIAGSASFHLAGLTYIVLIGLIVLVNN